LTREIATEIRGEGGSTIDPGEDGRGGVEKMSAGGRGDYDLILMDVQRPLMAGYEPPRRIRALDNGVSGIPIIAMTANAFEEDRRQAIDSGMDEHIAKPIDIGRLKETLARFL
ncbi:MAG: hybrid sensor histidine kinase/response regulator, partial [Clostridiales bacterium]|nr:hybrid sensor histidine kinase/response regulator [Clostridiales bacterium]